MASHSTFNPTRDKARSLYVHVPFCRHRCGYCYFSLVAGRDDLIDRYLNALATEVGWLTHRPTVATIFLGGGTPSQLAPRQIERLFATLRDAFSWPSGIEISVECNPGDLNFDRAEVLRDCGVNRISFGVQSFDDRKLAVLERDHRADDIARAVGLARTVTDNISLDLMFATPGESAGDFERDLAAAFALSPAHLSLYELTFEKGTQFWNRSQRGELSIPAEDLRADLYQLAMNRATGAGMQHYEISSFSRPDRCCRHNLSYWNGDDYFAFGPGAARFIDGVRETNHRSTTAWLKRVEASQSPVCDRQELSGREIAVDRVVFGLRQIAGFSVTQFTTATGLDLLEFLGDAGSMLLDYSLIEIVADRCRLTAIGIMLYDSVAAKIVEAA